ncbi:hypothetical protein NZL82_14470 [Sphingomonas sanguinis]|nr:hypothetical protein [Sphingomonas sp. LC-1]
MMEAMVTSLTRRAPVILYLVSARLLIGNVAGSVIVANLTANQAHGVMAPGMVSAFAGVATSQIVTGIIGSFQSAAWPFAAAALIQSIREKSSI